MLELRESAQTRDTSTRYPEDVKELAYQLWAFLSGRNASEVSRQLMTADYGAVEVPRETVAYWAREYGWADRAAREVHAIAPDLRHQAFSELLFAGLEGSKYIRQVAAGQHDHVNIDDILKDDELDVLNKRLRIDARIKAHDSARKARLQASIAAKDAIGFSPVGKGAPGVELPAGDEDATPDFATMSVEELRVWREQQKRRRKR